MGDVMGEVYGRGLWDDGWSVAYVEGGVCLVMLCVSRGIPMTEFFP